MGQVVGVTESLPPLTLHEYLTAWTFTPVADIALAVSLGLYIWGFVAVGRRHPNNRWPWWRAVVFALGLLSILVALDSGVGVYDDVLFYDHMTQHLLLLAVAPPLLVLGRPVLLALHATRNPWHRWVLAACRSRVVTAITFPLVGFAAYTAAVVGTHLTRFMDLSLRNPTAHELEHLVYLVSGYLFFLIVIGGEPIRWRSSFPVQFAMIGGAMTVDAFTGIVLMQTNYVEFPGYGEIPRDWGPSLIGDLHLGGGIMWIGGGILMTIVMIGVIIDAIAGHRRLTPKWVDQARAAHIYGEDAVRRGTDVDSDEAALESYNRYLQGLNRNEGPGSGHGP